MTAITLITVVVLAAVSILLMGVLLGAVIRALPFKITRWSPVEALKKAYSTRGLQLSQRRLNAAAAAIEAAQFSQASKLLRGAIVLDYPARLADESNDQNLAVLELIVVIADKRGGRIQALPVVEDLLHSRLQLYEALSSAQSAATSFRNRLRQKGKETPAWAGSEFQRKLVDLSERIATNHLSLSSQLDQLFRELNEIVAHDSASVTYH